MSGIPTITAITAITARAVAIRGNEIDTDRIIPARYLRCVSFDGLGEFAFRDERYDTSGAPKKHPFNDPRFAGAGILVANSNFGCGSSREHAPQALARWGARADSAEPGGIRAIIAESFADIFAANCAAIGIVAASASAQDVTRLQAAIEADPKTVLTLDLKDLTVSLGELTLPVSLPETQRRKFLAGSWDTLASLLANQALIEQAASRLPYLSAFAGPGSGLA